MPLSRTPGRTRTAIALAAAALAVVGTATAVTTTAGSATPNADAARVVQSAPGAPGVLSRFDLARKDCVGTARTGTSKVWYTVADGVLSDVYEPFIDNTNVQSLKFVVTDGSTFTDLQTRDTTYKVHADLTGMRCTVVTSAHDYRLSTTFITDPARDSVVIRTALQDNSPTKRTLRVYARLDAHVNGNGGGGTANGGADSASLSPTGTPVIGDRNTVSQAANRDYAVPTFMALDAATFHGASVGYAGTASDGLTALDARHGLRRRFAHAPNGHVVATANVTPKRTGVNTVVLGFGRTYNSALRTAQASLSTSLASIDRAYVSGWQQYDQGLARPYPTGTRSTASTRAISRSYYLSANVLKSSIDKTFPGAIAASLSSPWGQAVSAGDLPGGKPVYFGSYREVFARDLYEAVTGLLADGDIAEAKAATLFLFLRQQQPLGNMPRNSLLNGKAAPDTGGDQLDETAYPILMAYLTGLGAQNSLYSKHIVPAADYLVSHGPSSGNERWEEQSGYSPSTIAAEIAGLTAAAAIATQHGDTKHARLYQAVADDFQRTIKAHTVTTNGPYSTSPYFIRLSKNGDPSSAYTYSLGNGSVSVDQRAVVDGGFQELVRLGELSAHDPVVLNSLTVLDKQISKNTRTGTGYYRYGTDASAGSTDGYGDCYVADPTDCPKNGQPWPTTDTGSGHLWPVLSGERAQTALLLGDHTRVDSQLAFMMQSASGVGLVPEQAWEDPAVAKDPYGTDPATASIGFRNGSPAGSASPLTWAQAQLLRLIRDRNENRVLDRPSITTQRYVRHRAPAAVPVTITAPADGTSVSGSVTVTGTTTAGAQVEVSSVSDDTAGAASVVSTVAGSDGSFSANVPAGFGTDVVTVAATTAKGTGTAHVTVAGALVGGTTVLDTADVANDDNGGGTYQYPTDQVFAPGVFDITRFEVLTKGGTVYLRTTLRNLQNTFGDNLGAQLIDVYIHNPAATSTSTSTSAAYASRNYTVAPSDAWSQRITVRGFAAPEWVDAKGAKVGDVGAVITSPTSKTVTIAVPQSLFGTPASGWSVLETLTGQDGYGTDGARNFEATPGGYTFGVCAKTTAGPCSTPPNTVPKVMDMITRGTQATELDLSSLPAVLTGVQIH